MPRSFSLWLQDNIFSARFAAFLRLLKTRDKYLCHTAPHFQLTLHPIRSCSHPSAVISAAEQRRYAFNFTCTCQQFRLICSLASRALDIHVARDVFYVSSVEQWRLFNSLYSRTSIQQWKTCGLAALRKWWTRDSQHVDDSRAFILARWEDHFFFQ